MGELIEVSTLTDLAPGTCRQVDAGGRPVAVFNVNGTIYAIHGNVHPSRRSPGGRRAGRLGVTCPWHGA